MGGDRQNWMRPIFAFSTRDTPEFTTFCVSTSPSTSSQSSMVPLERGNGILPQNTKHGTAAFRGLDGKVHRCSVASAHPSFFTMRMSLRSTLVAVAGSMTFITASTLMGASRLEYWDTTLELSAVVALLSRVGLSLRSTGWLMSVSTSTPFSAAFWKDSEMIVG